MPSPLHFAQSAPAPVSPSRKRPREEPSTEPSGGGGSDAAVGPSTSLGGGPATTGRLSTGGATTEDDNTADEPFSKQLRVSDADLATPRESPCHRLP